MDDSVATGTAREALPGAAHRWRCGGCGNLTRFDVVRTQKSREYWHVDLSGEGGIEESTTLSESIESITCRWCGRSDTVELVERPDAARLDIDGRDLDRP